jgi:hypothetical protein
MPREKLVELGRKGASAVVEGTASESEFAKIRSGVTCGLLG